MISHVPGLGRQLRPNNGQAGALENRGVTNQNYDNTGSWGQWRMYFLK